jgi:hypothetical protein
MSKFDKFIYICNAIVIVKFVEPNNLLHRRYILQKGVNMDQWMNLRSLPSEQGNPIDSQAASTRTAYAQSKVAMHNKAITRKLVRVSNNIMLMRVYLLQKDVSDYHSTVIESVGKTLCKSHGL